MEELNNVLENTMEVLDSKEIVNKQDSVKKLNTEGIVIMTIIGASFAAGAWGLKKLAGIIKDNRESKKIQEFEKMETVETSEEDETFI